MKAYLGRLIALAAFLALACFCATPLISAPPALPTGFPANIQLSAKARGEDAITSLGARLPEVATYYRKTAQDLRNLLRQDRSLWVDPQGRLFYVCDWQPPEESVTGQSIGTTDPSPFPPEQTFRLHSRPSATRVIYLDFDGHDASTTVWGADAIGRPFDIDGNPGNFSSTERDRIVYIWQRVAADYAMYDIDVTTEDPGIEALRKTSTSDANYGIRVVIAGGSTDWYVSSGGVAYVGSFDDSTDLPCWVFPKSLGPDNEKYVAEAISHEAGHTLGLSHDGTTLGVSYYAGQGNWAPIMGVGYYEPIAQWSKGEYANANNLEDDLAVMLNYGAAYRADDHGNTIATATALPGVNFSGRGTIERTTDVDFFSFKTGAGRVAFTVNRAPRDSNLRMQVALYDGSGTLLLTTNSADTSGGTQPVSISTVLAAGNYAFSVEGIGNGDPATTGYSDYASLGEYLITGGLPSDSAWLPTAAGTSYLWTDPANWASNTVPDGVGAKMRFNNNLAGDQTITLTNTLTLGGLFLGDVDASHGFSLQGGGSALNFDALTNAAFISKTTGASDTIAVPLVLLDSLIITNSTANPLTLLSNVSGTGSLTKAGAGRLVLAGNGSYTGGTIVSAGQLMLADGASLAGTIELKAGAILDASAVSGGWNLTSGQVLSGAGSAAGDFSLAAGARLVAGGNGVAGTFAFSNRLALNSGATLQFELAPTDTPGGNINDLFTIGGDLALNGTVAVDLRFLATAPASPGVYTLLRYSGALTGGATNLVPVNYTNRYIYAFDDTTPGEIRLTVSGAPAALNWKGDGLVNRWDLNGATNWLIGAVPAPFQQMDSVAFDDSGSPTPSVSLVGALTPAAVSVIATSNFAFAGSGRLSGATGLTKLGAGTLTLSNANDFTGPVTVSEGTLRAGDGSALGATNGSTTIVSGARLDLNAVNLGAESILVSGAGIGGAGALVSSNSAAQSNALRFVTLSGDTTFGGTGRWDIRAAPTGALTGNNFNLTKTGTNEIWLGDLGNTGLRDINLAQGALVFQDSTTMGVAANTLTIAPSARLSLWNTDVNALSKKLVMNGGSLRSDAGDNIFAGATTLNSNVAISVSAILEIQGVISGGGGFTNFGPGILSLTAANTFTGAVTVSSGTLRAGNAAALGSTNGSTTIASDARLDVAGFNLGAEPIYAAGDGLGNAGAIINYGGSQQNALRFVTLTGNTTFGGISRWDIRANPTAALAGNNKTLTKRGINEVWIVNTGDTGLGPIAISEGLLGFQGTTTLGSPLSNITVSSGCSLGLWATDTNILVKAMTLSTGRIYNASGTNTFAGPCTLTGSNTFDIASGTFLEMAGPLSSSGTLNKYTAGTLILSTNNSYTGGSTINAGTLQIGKGAGAGTPGSGTIADNSALVFSRTNDFTIANFITGSGTLTKLGSGILTLTASNDFAGAVTLNALNAGVLRLRHSNALGLGPKSVNLKSGGSPNTAGSFGVEVENNISIPAGLAWNISNDGAANPPNLPALRSRSGTNAISGPVLIQSGGGGARIVSDAGSTLTLAGAITTDVSAGRDLILDGAGIGIVSGLITNGSATDRFVNVSKEGTGTWTISAFNAYSGPTLVKAGTLLITGFTGTNSLSVSNGATLGGTGVVLGRTLINGTLAPGLANAVGSITISNALTLAGGVTMRISRPLTPTNDLVRGMATLNLGGSLTVTNLGGALAHGDVFRLFSAGSYAGAFASLNLPAPGPGLVWSNRLALDGSLVVATVAKPLIQPVSLVGTNLNLQFPTESGANYVLQGATNLASPTAWVSISTNIGNGGWLILSPPVDPLQPQRYFRIMVY